MRSFALSKSIHLRLAIVGLTGFLLSLLIPQRRIRSFKTALVLGNGPSLNEDLKATPLDDYEAKIAVNFFAATDYFVLVRPSHYLMQDPFWFESREVQDEKSRKAVDSILDKTAWPMEFLFPAEYQGTPTVKSLEANKNIKLIPLPQYSWPGFLGLMSAIDLLPHMESDHLNRLLGLMDKGWAQIHSNNVVATALFELIQGDTKVIELIGLDMTMANDLELTSEKKVKFAPTHFYGKLTEGEFGLAGLGLTVAQAYRGVAQKFEIFYLLEKYARKKNLSVTNRSTSTLLDAF